MAWGEGGGLVFAVWEVGVSGVDLDDYEAGATAVGGGEVNVGLIIGDVEALDGASAGLKRCWCSTCGQEEGENWSKVELHIRYED